MDIIATIHIAYCFNNLVTLSSKVLLQYYTIQLRDVYTKFSVIDNMKYSLDIPHKIKEEYFNAKGVKVVNFKEDKGLKGVYSKGRQDEGVVMSDTASSVDKLPPSELYFDCVTDEPSP